MSLLAIRQYKYYTSHKLAGPNGQNQIGPIRIFCTHFVLFCTTKKNFVPYAISEKTMALLASYEASRTKAKNNQNRKNKTDSFSAQFVLFCTTKNKYVSFVT